ncbi:MAG: hypothetical protein ACREDO_01065 [Methyloceanibacter sp.]
MANPDSLGNWRTEELEQGLYSGSLDVIQRHDAERILRERERAPDREFARRLYNVAAWTLAFSIGAFVLVLIIFWMIATGK